MIELSKEEKKLYLHRIFTMCVEMTNVSKVMREIQDDSNLIHKIEELIMECLNHISKDVQQIEQEELKNKIDPSVLTSYMSFLNN